MAGYTTPTTQGASSVIPTSRLNAYKTALDYLAQNKAHCAFAEATAQSIPTGTWTALTSNDAETFDVTGMHSTVTNTSRITVPSGEAGKFLQLATVNFAAAAAGGRFVGFGRNGANPGFSGANQLGSASISPQLTAVQLMPRVAADYDEVKVFQDSGGSVNATLNNVASIWMAV